MTARYAARAAELARTAARRSATPPIPRASVWVCANAGTGKTHVLTSACCA